jgi:hypothetical protein
VGEVAGIEPWGVLLAGDPPLALEEPLKEEAAGALGIEHAGDGVREQQDAGVGIGLQR